ncbi:MAG: peptide ABC transporter substrate-binding protein [Anaerolineae bacterium]|nr:peptide ABC transporter substrate-binding protein [Anaerolineae bacterium]
MKTHRFGALAFLLVALYGVLSISLAQGPKILYTGRQMGPDDIPTLDPSLASDVPSVQIITELFPELGRLHEEEVFIQPGMAESWEVSADGLVYTFKIRPNVAWVRYNRDSGQVEQVLDEAGNPRFVTASDFVIGFIRTMDPRNASDYAYVLTPWIAGGDDFASSDPAADDATRQALIDALGVKALDDSTLQVTTTQASAAFESIIGMWITTAQPAWAIEEFGDLWIEADNIQTYGPFALKEWNRGQDLTLIKNPFWVGTEAIPAPKLDEVVFRFFDPEAQLAAFEAGELQVSEVPNSAIDRVKADPVLSQGYRVSFGSCTYYYGFNVRKEPFNDPRAVRAFSMTIDRQAIVDNITRAGESPAGFFTLPSMNAAPQQADYPEFAARTDVEAGKALWEEYLASVGKTSADFNLTILHNNSSLHAAIAQAIQQMWAEALGVQVNIAAQDFGTYLVARRDADIFRAAWCFDYPDTNNWLFDVFHSSVDPDNGFSNAEYDALVEAAAVASTEAERIELYAQAENILVNTSASIAPIYYYVTKDLTAPGVERTHSVITREYYEKWDLVGQ